MKKEITEITFADGTKGTITTETITGRVDVKAAYNNMTEFYYAERIGRNWIVKICINGFCNDAVIMVSTKTRSAAISEIIQNVKRNQSITADSAELPTPSDEPKTEKEEEAAAEHFVKQMSEKGYFNEIYGKAVNQMSDAEPEYMGGEYMDARSLNNWNELLIEKKYGMVREHDKIYCVTSYGKVFSWFWNVKCAQQFQGIYGGDILRVDSDLFFIERIHDKFLDIICTVETNELNIESQLIYAGYLNNIENRPAYIFACLQSYTQCFELEMMVNEMHLSQHELSIQKFLKCTYRDLANGKDYEKSLLEWCKDMEYLTERIIADYLKEGENNDNP
jgi:hypothetical protein